MKSICMWGEIQLLGRLLSSCQLRNFPRVVTEKVLPFLTNQAALFTSRGIGRSYFSENFLLSFLLWYNFKILVKSKGGHSCSNHSNLEVEAQCLTKTLSYLNLNISKTKNGRNKL